MGRAAGKVDQSTREIAGKRNLSEHWRRLKFVPGSDYGITGLRYSGGGQRGSRGAGRIKANEENWIRRKSVNVKGIERIDVFPLAHLTTIPRQLLTPASFFVRLPRRNENRINQEWLETAFFPLLLRCYVAETIRLEKHFLSEIFWSFSKKLICLKMKLASMIARNIFHSLLSR